MTQKIFTVYDSKAEAYLPPFYTQATGLALRSFEAAANKPDHDFCKYPADYTLFELGTFDEQTANFTFLPAMLNLGIALQFQNHLPDNTAAKKANNGEISMTEYHENVS